MPLGQRSFGGQCQILSGAFFEPHRHIVITRELSMCSRCICGGFSLRDSCIFVLPVSSPGAKAGELKVFDNISTSSKQKKISDKSVCLVGC